MSWAENVFGEAALSQWSLDDENNPMHEDDEVTQGEENQIGDNTSKVEEEEVPLQQEETGGKRVNRKMNGDYSKKNQRNVVLV